MTLEDLLTLPLPERIAWLHSEAGPKGRISLDHFAESIGAPGRQTVIAWEKGGQPSQRYADALAEFSGFPAWAFRRRESEAAAFESFARRLGELEAQQSELRDLVLEAFDVIRALEAQGVEVSAATPLSRAKRRSA